MKIIAIEEHFVTPAALAATDQVPAQWQPPGLSGPHAAEMEPKLLHLGEGRLARMDATGVDMQVLSLTEPGCHNLPPDAAIALQHATNDLIAETVAAHPDRFEGFATLATPAPDAAARELERAVRDLGLNGAMLFGRTRDRNADDAAFWPIYEAAADLRAPLYLHPQAPQTPVRQAVYGGLGDETLDTAFAMFGLGWHYETGIQILRLVLAGVFDRFPELQIVTGHWGEVVLFYLDRIDNLSRFAKLERPVSDYFRTNVSVTPSGIWSDRYLRWAIEVLGVDRILFSTDDPYRFTPDGGARRFLEEAELSETDRAAIAHGNWERMVAAIRR